MGTCGVILLLLLIFNCDVAHQSCNVHGPFLFVVRVAMQAVR